MMSLINILIITVKKKGTCTIQNNSISLQLCFQIRPLGVEYESASRLNTVWIVFRNVTVDMLTFLYWLNEVENVETNDMNQ